MKMNINFGWKNCGNGGQREGSPALANAGCSSSGSFGLAQTLQEGILPDQTGQTGQNTQHLAGISLGTDQQDHDIDGPAVLRGNIHRFGQGRHGDAGFA